MSNMGKNYYHTDDPITIEWLIAVLSRALEQGQSVRLYTDMQSLTVKRGEGAWSAPLTGTPDVYRDSVDIPTVVALDKANR